MSKFRFNIGTTVLCNLGQKGWKLGKIIALNYREDHWKQDIFAPYQVILDDEETLIYVPEDDARYCRKPTQEDLRISRRLDALAAFPSETRTKENSLDYELNSKVSLIKSEALDCSKRGIVSVHLDYRKGHCHCCDSCPQNWSYVELYSEHYRCALRNSLKITRQTIDLGTVHVGEEINYRAIAHNQVKEGFLQCPTMVRLPPGIQFYDDGSLNGVVQFDPNKEASYKVNFVAVSTVHWKNTNIGLFRLELTFIVEDNLTPDEFDMQGFIRLQELARKEANQILSNMYTTWDYWEKQTLSNNETCQALHLELNRLRDILKSQPRLDNGLWWVYLGGFYMNVHKLLENTLFECEYYLGYALSFGSLEIRRMAEQNLKGCYQKRLLEAARFMWMDGVREMIQGEWYKAANILCEAAAKKDGWGWAVNYGDIWISESTARLIHGATLAIQSKTDQTESEQWISEAKNLLTRSLMRVKESGDFGSEGHPWADEVSEALETYERIRDNDGDISEWLANFKLRTVYWCAQILGGAYPFPPKPKPRQTISLNLNHL